MVNAGHADNALPQSAKAIVNCRILPHDDPTDIDRQLKQVIGNDKISVRYVNQPLSSPASPLDGELVKTVDALTQQMWGVPVIPAMSTGATDSRFMRNAGIRMYGVSGLFTEPSDMRAHGLDERIEIARLYDGREFLYRLVKQLAE
jgi:acetylornithine deacetylase/succinyl-diaminopimelate desuccinylase-like protein